MANLQPKRGYVFQHHSDNGILTGFFYQVREGLQHDAEAELLVYGIARQLAQQGLTTGEIRVAGSLGAHGYTYAVKILQAVQSTHPLEEMEHEILPYAMVADTIARLWPYDQPSLVVDPRIVFTVLDGQMEVELSRPFGDFVTMTYLGRKVEGHLCGPDLFQMRLYWAVTPEQGREIWQQVVNEVLNVRVKYGMPDYVPRP